MMRFNRRGMRSLKNRTPKAAGQTIYLRRGDDTLTITGAMQSPSTVTIAAPDGVPVKATVCDWWLPTDQVIFDPAVSAGLGDNKPRMGDEISTPDGLFFEPMRPGAGADAVSPVALGCYWLVHTKQTGTPVPVESSPGTWGTTPEDD